MSKGGEQTLKKRTTKPSIFGRHFRLWENEHGVVGWDDQSKSRKAARLLGEGILGISDSRGRRASGFIVTKLAAKRWQVIAFAADRGIIV